MFAGTMVKAAEVDHVIAHQPVNARFGQQTFQIFRICRAETGMIDAELFRIVLGDPGWSTRPGVDHPPGIQAFAVECPIRRGLRGWRPGQSMDLAPHSLPDFFRGTETVYQRG